MKRRSALTCRVVAVVGAVGVVGALLVPSRADAYIDPGTAGFVVGGGATVLAWVLVGLAAMKLRLRALLGAIGRRFKGGPNRPALAAALIMLCCGGATAWLWSGGAATTATSSRSDRVLLLGLDGVDPKMLGDLMDRGLLPTFSRIRDAGSFKPLAIPNPPESPVVWATLATGQNPGRHGVFDFIGRDPEEYLPSLSLLSRNAGGYEYPIRARSFWDVTTEHQVPTTIMRWPMTFPPVAVSGRMLPGLGVPDVRGGLGRYTMFTDRAPAAGEEGADKVTVVAVQDGAVEAVLHGPQARGLSGVKDTELPLSVKLGEDGKSALVTLGEQTVALAQGEWSRHIDLTFTSGLFGKHHGQVKLLLVSGREPFALLATSVELSPDAPLIPFTHPPEYAAELKAAIGPYHTLGMPEETKAFGEGRMTEEHFLRMCEDVEAERRAMLLYELKRFERGVLAFVFDTSDRIQHMTPLAGDVAQSAIGRYLIEFDRFLATVLQRLPEDTALVLFSDHGFSTFEQSVDLNRWLVDQGYLVIDDAAYRARPAGSAGELYQYVDWERSKAYAVGFAGIFINVAGREGQGTVPAEDRVKVAAEIKEKLAQLKDPATGAAVVHHVYARADLYAGPREEDAPDLVVGLKAGYRGAWQSAVGGLTDHVVAPNEKRWQRDHIVDASFVPGILLTSFPLAIADPHAMDLAPTVLSLLGLPVPEEMEGRPLQEGAATVVAGRAAPRGDEAMQ